MDIMLQRTLDLIGNRHGAGQELVQALGLSKNTVTEWKSGRSKSYTKYAAQIATYYGVSLDWLSGASEEKEIKEAPNQYLLTQGEADLIELFRQIPEDKQDFLLAMIKSAVNSQG